MKKVKQYLVSIIYVILGVVLIGLGFIEKLDSFWSGMGCQPSAESCLPPFPVGCASGAP